MAHGVFYDSKDGPSFEEISAPALHRYEIKVFDAIIHRLKKASDYDASRRKFGFQIKSPPRLYKRQRTLAFEVFFYNSPTTIRSSRGRDVRAKANSIFIDVSLFDGGQAKEVWEKVNVEWDLKRSPDDVARVILSAIPYRLWQKWERRRPTKRKRK